MDGDASDEIVAGTQLQVWRVSESGAVEERGRLSLDHQAGRVAVNDIEIQATPRRLSLFGAGATMPLDPDGNLVIYVSNQSYEIDPATTAHPT
jgi:hypothetical protein